MAPRIGALMVLILSLAMAQSVREAGMGGVGLPGPGTAWENPALAAVEARFDRGTWSIPVGLLGLLLPDRSPLYYFVDPTTFYQSFDLLRFYDQLGHPESLLVNPAQSPDEVVLKARQDESGRLQFRLEDGQGHPLQLTTGENIGPRLPPGLTPAPFFTVPFGLGPGLYGEIGLFAGIEELALNPDPKLSALLNGGSLEANQTYRLTARGAASAGVSLGFGLARALPPLPGLPGRLYAGVRGQGFLGLARTRAEASTAFTTDGSGQLSGSNTTSRIFYSYLGQGLGYGVRLDAGLAYADKSGIYGLGVRNLVSFAQWQGTEVTTDSGGTRTGPRTETVSGLAPALYLNGAGYLPLEGNGRLLLAADLGYDGRLYAHLGMEYPVGALALRGGLGYEDGVRLGVGLGVDLAGLKLDLALTSHTAPLVGGQVFGLAAAVGF